MTEETSIQRNKRYLLQAEGKIAKARNFIEVHEDRIADLDFFCVPSMDELILRPRMTPGNPSPADIARRFPGAEWKRGSMTRKPTDWVAQIDGMRVAIEDADMPGEMPEKVDLGKGGGE